MPAVNMEMLGPGDFRPHGRADSKCELDDADAIDLRYPVFKYETEFFFQINGISPG